MLLLRLPIPAALGALTLAPVHAVGYGAARNQLLLEAPQEMWALPAAAVRPQVHPVQLLRRPH